MKVQVITANDLPAPGRDVHGTYRRMALFMDALGALAARIDIAHLVPEASLAAAADPDRLDAEQSGYWGHQVAVTLIGRRRQQKTFRTHYVAGLLRAAEQWPVFPFTGPDQAAAVQRLLQRRPDLVFVHRLPAMCAMLRAQALSPAGVPDGAPPVFFDLDDVEHLVRLRACLQPPLWPGKLIDAAQVPAMIVAERRAAALSRKMFVCSQKDRDHLGRLGMRGKVAVVPNAVAFPAAPPPLPAEPTLLFLGACHYEPNAQAAERLVSRILPLVRQDLPAARLLVAGKDSQNLPSRRRAPDGVEYLGFVEDLQALYARARVVCCPITQGGGTRVKLVEAAGFARPMVATRIGAEGLAFVDEQEILLRDSDAAFAAACVRLLRDPDLGQRLGQAAHARAWQLYDRDQITNTIARIFRNG